MMLRRGTPLQCRLYQACARPLYYTLHGDAILSHRKYLPQLLLDYCKLARRASGAIPDIAPWLPWFHMFPDVLPRIPFGFLSISRYFSLAQGTFYGLMTISLLFQYYCAIL
jgi:hypothetical protein